MKNFFKLFSLFLTLLIPVMAADGARVVEDFDPEKTLIIGCRPWDECIQGSGLEEAHFLDMQENLEEKPAGDFPKFHHMHIPSPEFEAYAIQSKKQQGRFSTILIDWGTYHHLIHSTCAFIINFRLSWLLESGGKLIIPTAFHKIISRNKRENHSEEQAELYRKNFDLNKRRFASAISYVGNDDLPVEARIIDFLKRYPDSWESGRIVIAKTK